MTSPRFQEVKESNPFNPFNPTERDIKRTEQLAEKNPNIAGLLTFLLLPAAMIYLNRGVNSLKILGYALLITFSFIIVTETPEEEASKIGEIVGSISSIFMIIENASAVNQAKKRQQGS